MAKTVMSFRFIGGCHALTTPDAGQGTQRRSKASDHHLLASNAQCGEGLIRLGRQVALPPCLHRGLRLSRDSTGSIGRRLGVSVEHMIVGGGEMVGDRTGPLETHLGIGCRFGVPSTQSPPVVSASGSNPRSDGRHIKAQLGRTDEASRAPERFPGTRRATRRTAGRHRDD